MVTRADDGRVAAMLALLAVGRRFLAEQVLEGEVEHAVHADHARRFRAGAAAAVVVEHLVHFADAVVRREAAKLLDIQSLSFLAPVGIAG